MKVIILGSGIIGVTTAYYLTLKGFEVTVIDRQKDCATECSYANGGQLSYSHTEPWANPQIFSRVPAWILKRHSPLSIKNILSANMWKWINKFFNYCTHQKVKDTSQNIWRLSTYSKKCMEDIEQDTGIAYTQSKEGSLHLFTSKKYLYSNLEHAKFQQGLGCDYSLLEGSNACVDKEQSLKHAKINIAGGIYYPIDGSGDVHEFSQNLKKIAEDKGVKFIYGVNIEKIITQDQQVIEIKTDQGIFTADKYVMALGAHSPLILKEIGINIPIYPLKGYSLSIKIDNPEFAPKINITDQANKIVFSRLGNILRVTGMVEFAGYNNEIKTQRISTLKEMTKKLFPRCGNIEQATNWSCMRPATPDGAPILGKSPYKNLFLNTGHGTLGWTLSLGSSKILADIVADSTPKIDLTGLTLKRFL